MPNRVGIDGMFLAIYSWYAGVFNDSKSYDGVTGFFTLTIRFILFIIMICLFLTHFTLAIITLNKGATIGDSLIFWSAADPGRRGGPKGTYQWRQEKIHGGPEIQNMTGQYGPAFRMQAGNAQDGSSLRVYGEDSKVSGLL